MKQLYQALSETGKLAAVALFCVGTASAFGWMSPTTRSRRRCWANVTPGGWHHRRGILYSVRVPGGRLLPRRDSRDHHRRHHPAAAGRVGEHAPDHFAIIASFALAFGLVTRPMACA